MRKAAFLTASRISILSTKTTFIIAEAAGKCKVLFEFSGGGYAKNKEDILADFYKKYLVA